MFGVRGRVKQFLQLKFKLKFKCIVYMYVIASRQQNSTKLSLCLPASSMTRLPKQDHKCVSLLGKKFDGFSSAKLYQQWILHLHVVMKKKHYNFPKKSEVPKFIHVLPVKITWLNFSAVSGVKIKKFTEIRVMHGCI